MLLHSIAFPMGGHCTLSLVQPEGWLRATWSGYVTPDDALRGAAGYLVQAGSLQCLGLLNDNTALHGPWFDSLKWLDETWLPLATRLGLRYIAHVVQVDTHRDILTRTASVPIPDVFELQLFDDVASAQEWLRTCQPPPPAPKLATYALGWHA